MAFSAPSLTRICVIKVVTDIKKFCYGLTFDDLGKFKFIVGPFDNLSSQCIEEIFEYVIFTKQLNSSWLSLLIVPHLRGVDFKHFPGGVTPKLFKILKNRCHLLERVIIPNCRKISNGTLSDLLGQNPSLLELDISNKVSPKVDVSIVETLAYSCRCLTILQLSDYRASDPRTLLMLCGKQAIEKQRMTERTSSIVLADYLSQTIYCQVCGKVKSSQALSAKQGQSSQPMKVVTTGNEVQPLQLSSLDSVARMSIGTELYNTDHRPTVVSINSVCQCASEEPTGNTYQGDAQFAIELTNEERENQKVDDVHLVAAGDNVNLKPDNSDEDLYESDGSLTALNIEDCGTQYGCLELETLCLDNVNITDQVMAVLLQYLPRLRNLNLCDTDICNPWRLLDPSHCIHLLQLEELDIKSTALSRTALELIPKFHPDLQRFSISSTTLPPHTYANIGKLTGVADLELIGGQFYPSEPKEIFDKGIAPAIRGIGQHLRLLNLTYFAHIEFEVIPKSCPKLERLDLSCAVVTFLYPCESLGDCCPNLRNLNLAFCHIEAKEGTIDNLEPVSPTKALQKMIGQPPKLTELNMSGLAVSDETLRNIFPRAIQPLQVLNLSRCSLATVNGINYIWNNCPYLHTIDLTYCRDVTVGDFASFETKCFEERPLFKVEGKLNWK